MKIKDKLTLLFCTIVAAILLIFSISIFFFYSLFREIEFYERLRDKAVKTAELLLEVKEIDEEILKIIDKHDITTLSKEEIMMYGTDHKLFYKSGEEYIHFPDAFLNNVIRKKEVKHRLDDRETIGILSHMAGKDMIVIASAVDVYGYQKLENLMIILIFGWIVCVFIVFLAGRYFSANALSPISEVISQVDKITASNLNMRVNQGTGRDEIAQLASTFNKMLERLEEAFVMQKNFVANASHELRTPLTAVTGQIEVVLMQDRQKEEYIFTMNSILDDIKGLTKMSNGLLELAKVSSDQAVFKIQDLRIDDLVWQSQAEVKKKNASYSVKVDFENFPEDETRLIVRGNDNLLITAFVNLMENGCKFSRNKTVDVLVFIFEREIKLLFMDVGIGIDKKSKPYIFQPFYRSDDAKKTSGGYGIGLSLVDKIVKLHNGTVEVSSNVGVGTIFTINLPK